MSYKALCYFIIGFMILSLIYFGYNIMHNDSDANKASITSHSTPKQQEKKINFVLVINTEMGPEGRNVRKTPLSTREIESPFSENLKLGSLKNFSNIKKSKSIEGLVPQNMLNTKAIFIPHNPESHKNDWEENSDRFGSGDHRAILKFNPFGKQQESNLNLSSIPNRKEESSSSSTSY